MNYFKKKKAEEKALAEEHIISLFKEANAIAPKSIERANRYVAIARRMSARLKVRIPPQLKRTFCKKCGVYRTSVTARIRLTKGKKTYNCLKCGFISRIRTD